MVRPPRLVHVLLGLDDWDAGRVDQARIHLEQAYRLDPSAGIVSNNLAWVLANGPDPDLKRALRWPMPTFMLAGAA